MTINHATLSICTSYTKMDLMCCPKQSARIVEWILWGVLIQS